MVSLSVLPLGLWRLARGLRLLLRMPMHLGLLIVPIWSLLRLVLPLLGLLLVRQGHLLLILLGSLVRINLLLLLLLLRDVVLLVLLRHLLIEVLWVG